MRHRSFEIVHFFILVVAVCLLANCQLDPQVKRYAIIYGIADYETLTPDLVRTVSDADAIEEVCIRNSFTVYKRVDSEATKAEFQALFASLATIVQPHDTVLFYFSGHGEVEVIAPWEATLSDENSLISLEDLKAAFTSLTSRNNIVILDSCKSGSFASSASAIDLLPPNTGEAEIGDYAIWESPNHVGALLTRWISPEAGAPFTMLAAAGAEENSYEDTYGYFGFYHGVFTFYLLSAINRYDPDFDGWVSSGELMGYINYGLSTQFNVLNSYYATTAHQSGSSLDRVLFKSGTGPIIP